MPRKLAGWDSLVWRDLYVKLTCLTGYFLLKQGPLYIALLFLRLISNTLYPQKLALTSPTSGGRSVDIVRSRTQTKEFVFLISNIDNIVMFLLVEL
jgi:hypothetical protein